MSFSEFETKIRKIFGSRIPDGMRGVWMDNQRSDGVLWRAVIKGANGLSDMFVSGNSISRRIEISGDFGSRYVLL